MKSSQLLPRVYEILVILALKYMGLMGDTMDGGSPLFPELWNSILPRDKKNKTSP